MELLSKLKKKLFLADTFLATDTLVLTILVYILFQIWVSSQHNGSGYFNVSAGDHLTEEHFTAMLANDKDGNKPQYARTGYLGFVKRTELTQTDGGKKYDYYSIF